MTVALRQPLFLCRRLIVNNNGRVLTSHSTHHVIQPELQLWEQWKNYLHVVWSNPSVSAISIIVPTIPSIGCYFIFYFVVRLRGRVCIANSGLVNNVCAKVITVGILLSNNRAPLSTWNSGNNVLSVRFSFLSVVHCSACWPCGILLHPLQRTESTNLVFCALNFFFA